MYYIVTFILGLVLGSFLTCAGYRLSINESISKPARSYCDICKHDLAWYDLIPVLSYIFTLGKCRYCNNKLSILYPITEILCGILYLTCYKVFGFSYQFIIAIILSSLFIMVLVSDINFLIIPDEIIISISILLIITSFVFTGFTNTLTNILYGVCMFVIMYLIMLLGNFIFKKETLGGADIKLMFISGFSLGIIPSFFTIFFASVVALPVSIILYIKNKENVIAYGPFLTLAILFLYLFKIDISKIIEIFTFV